MKSAKVMLFTASALGMHPCYFPTLCEITLRKLGWSKLVKGRSVRNISPLFAHILPIQSMSEGQRGGGGEKEHLWILPQQRLLGDFLVWVFNFMTSLFNVMIRTIRCFRGLRRSAAPSAPPDTTVWCMAGGNDGEMDKMRTQSRPC